MWFLSLLCVLGAMTVDGSSLQRQIVREVIPGIGSYFFQSEAMNWTDAAYYCRMHRNGNLAFPYTQDEATMLNTMMKTYKASYIHVGFHDQYKEGDYYSVTGDRVAQTCYNRWYTQNGGPDKNCGSYRDSYGFVDIACNIKYPFICVNYNFYRYQGCRDGYVCDWNVKFLACFREDFDYINGYGFYKMHRAQRSWFDAQQTCEAEGANLLVVNSEGELASLSNRFGNFETWVGVHHLFINWQFVTISDEILYNTGFHRWQVGQPSGTNDQKPYLAVNSAAGYGLTLKQRSDQLSFICEYRQALTVPPL